MLKKEERELLQKDKYELVEIIMKFKEGKNPLKKPAKKRIWVNPPVDGIKNAMDKLNKEMDYGKRESQEESETYREEENC